VQYLPSLFSFAVFLAGFISSFGKIVCIGSTGGIVNGFSFTGSITGATVSSSFSINLNSG
jgi:hypothetical protein